eukprot:g32009.t1
MMHEFTILRSNGMSLVLQEGDDNQEADDDHSNFDNDDNHDNSNFNNFDNFDNDDNDNTDDELKHVFKITDGLDVLFEKLRLVPYKTREKWKPALYLKMQDGLSKHETKRRTLLMQRPKPNAARPPKSAKTDLPERRFGRPPKSREAEGNSRATMPSRVVQRVLDADTQRGSQSSSSSSSLPSSPNLPDPRPSLDLSPSVSHVQPAGFPPQLLGPKHLPSHSLFPSVSYVQPAGFPTQLFVPLHLPNPSSQNFTNPILPDPRPSVFPPLTHKQPTVLQPQFSAPSNLSDPRSSVFPPLDHGQPTVLPPQLIAPSNLPDPMLPHTFPAESFQVEPRHRKQRKPNQSLFSAIR